MIHGFHSLLQDSLAEARGEGLLRDDELESAGEPDTVPRELVLTAPSPLSSLSLLTSSCRVAEPAVQIAAPSLALFFAALGSTGTPPSISSPDGSFVLSSSNCPPSFSNAFQLWQTCVKPIQQLSMEARHDLALMLCDKEPVSTPLSLQVARLASDLKGIALEILQVSYLLSNTEGQWSA